MSANTEQSPRLDVEAVLLGEHAMHLVLREVVLPKLLDAGDEFLVVQRGMVSAGKVPSAELGLVLSFTTSCGNVSAQM